MRISRKEIKKGDVFLGQTINVDIKKNKVSRPFTKASFDYYWEGGVDVIKDIMNTAIDMDIIHRAGAWYYLGESTKEPMVDQNGYEFKWQGRDPLEAVLKASPDFFQYLNAMVQGLIPRDAQMISEDQSDEQEQTDEEYAAELVKGLQEA